MSTFKAHVHYGDWEGSAAADSPPDGTVDDYLVRKGLITADDFVLSLSLWIGEYHDDSMPGTVVVHAFVYKGVDAYDLIRPILDQLKAKGEPIPVKEIKVELTLIEFISLFKQLSVVLTADGLDLHDVEYRIVD